MPNLFDTLPTVLPDELCELLVRGAGVRIERIVSTGQRSPDGFWYDQDEDEWVVVVRGHGAVRFADAAEPIVLGPGDHLLLPAHARHRVDWTDAHEPTVWLAVYFQGTGETPKII